MILFVPSKNWLHSKDFQAFVVADGDPVGLGGPPLDLVDFPLCGGVREDGVLDGPGHLLHVPNQRLVVVPWSKAKNYKKNL